MLPRLHDSDLYERYPAYFKNLRYDFFGLAEPLPKPLPHPRTAAGLFRELAFVRPGVACHGDQPCPQAGYWQAELPPQHPAALRLPETTARQAFVRAGEDFPGFARFAHLGIPAQQVVWRLAEARSGMEALEG